MIKNCLLSRYLHHRPFNCLHCVFTRIAHGHALYICWYLLQQRNPRITTVTAVSTLADLLAPLESDWGCGARVGDTSF